MKVWKFFFTIHIYVIIDRCFSRNFLTETLSSNLHFAELRWSLRTKYSNKTYSKMYMSKSVIKFHFAPRSKYGKYRIRDTAIFNVTYWYSSRSRTLEYGWVENSVKNVLGEVLGPKLGYIYGRHVTPIQRSTSGHRGWNKIMKTARENHSFSG